MTGTTSKQRREGGFALLQLLIVCAVAAIVAAIALPVYASRAKEVVLQENARNLERQVQSCLAVGLDTAFVPDGDRDADDTVSTTLSRVLHSGARGDAGRYVNPLTGSTAIMCQSAPPCTAGKDRPAVWITDDQHAAYKALAGSGRTNAALAGTLLVVFDADGGSTTSIDVFYVDRDGRPSADAATLTL
jgi:type II secretory pathway pseudopilin PulG